MHEESEYFEYIKKQTIYLNHFCNESCCSGKFIIRITYVSEITPYGQSIKF